MATKFDYTAGDSIAVMDWAKDQTLDQLFEEVQEVIKLQAYLNDGLWELNEEIKERMISNEAERMLAS